MKAITYFNYGPPEVLQIKEVEKPEPGEDEILIRVQAAEATKADCEMRAFKYSVKWFWLPLRIVMGITKPKKQILGGYFAGEIEAIGKNVTTFTVGDAVFGSAGFGQGAYGEYLCLPASGTITTKPNNMSFAAAAAVPLGGLNALHFMRKAKIQPGDKVLIIGAGGSIGSHAVQIAKTMGAEVTSVDSHVKQALLTNLGSDHFIDYTKENFADQDLQYDVVFDMVPSSSYAACINALKPKGRYLCGNPRLSIMIKTVFTNRFTSRSASFALAGESIEELQTLQKMIEAGDIVSIVDCIYPMEEAAEAHRRVETEQRQGAVVLAIGESVYQSV